MTIGIIAPSSPIRDVRLEKGIQAIEARGYKVVTGKHLYDKQGYLAGTDQSRAEDFNEMFADPNVDAIFCGRGGYGAVRILDYVDWKTVSENPKLFVGYSDITTLHLALEKKLNLVTLHGLMAVHHGGELSETAKDCFWKMVESAEPFGTYSTDGYDIKTLVDGKAEGRLAGGCLTLLTTAVGTPYAPDFTDRIVIIEDVGEVAYRIDRYLMQLLHSGLLNKAAGFVIGTVTDWDKDLKETPEITLDTLWKDYIIPLGKPTIVGFPFGHIANSLTLPLGCNAQLDADQKTLTVLEPAVS